MRTTLLPLSLAREAARSSPEQERRAHKPEGDPGDGDELASRDSGDAHILSRIVDLGDSFIRDGRGDGAPDHERQGAEERVDGVEQDDLLLVAGWVFRQHEGDDAEQKPEAGEGDTENVEYKHR